MSYSDGPVNSYLIAAHDFGAGGLTYEIAANGTGVVTRVELANITETFTDDTTEAMIQVGHAGTLGEQVDVSAGTAALGTALAWGEQSAGFTNVAIDGDNSPVLVTLVAPTGGTPAGIADVIVHIRWYC